MALALVSPPPAWASTASATTLTTAAFTPPAGALLLAQSMFDTATTTRTETTATVTGSTSAWTKLQHQNAGLGLVDSNWATVTSAVSTTVRTTWVSAGANDGALAVFVLTGQHPTAPIGQSGKGVAAANGSITFTVTPTTPGSLVFVSYAQFNGGGIPASAQLTTYGSLSPSATLASYYSAPLTAATTITLTGGLSGGAYNWVEVLPATAGPATGTAALTGSGTLAGAGKLADTETVALSGSGTVTAGQVGAAATLLRVGGLTPAAVRIGTVPADRVYLGSTLVWGTAPAGATSGSAPALGSSSALPYAAAARTSSAVPVPTGVAANDVVLVHFYTEDSAPAVTAPADFTELTFPTAPVTTGQVMRQRVFWKRATGADTGSYTFTHASAITEAVASRYTGCVTSGTPLEVLSSNVTSTSSATVTPVSGTTSGSNELLVWGLAHYISAAGPQTPAGFTVIADGSDLLVCYKTQTAAGGTGAITDTFTGTSNSGVTLLGLLPVPVPAGTTTGGSGGPLTDRENITFTNSAGVTSTYHCYAAGLNWSQPVGAIIYTDGSAEFGLYNPANSYLLGGPTGLIAVAKNLNMLLLTPMAPGVGCPDGDGVCWYQTSNDRVSAAPVTAVQKAQWSRDVIGQVYSQYNIDRTRIAFGGYSSGAQWATEYFGPAHGAAIMDDGVAVAISYGGEPAVTSAATAAHKTNVPYVWNTGDSAPEWTTISQFTVHNGESWYRTNGFTTEVELIPGATHVRDGQFGAVMDRLIRRHILGQADGATYATSATAVTGAWGTLTNLVGGTTGSYATWTSAVSAASATVEAAGYNLSTGIGAQDTITSVSAEVRGFVSSEANIASLTAQLYSGTTAVGAAVPLADSSLPTTRQTVTFPTAPTLAQLADLRVRITATRAANTTSSTVSLDTVGVTLNYTPFVAWPTGSVIKQPRAGALAGAGTGSTTMAVPYPANVAAGDFLVIGLPSRSVNTDANFSASGWTATAATSGTTASPVRFTFLTRVATTADATASAAAGSVTVTGPAVLRSAKMLAVAGVDTTTPLDGTPTVFQNAADTADPVVSMGSQTPTKAGCVPLWGGTGFLGSGVTYTSPDSGATEVLDTWAETAVANNRAGAVYYGPPLASTAASGTRSVTPSTSATGAGVFLLLRPA